MSIYCADCTHAKVSIVSFRTKEGNTPVYHLDTSGEITHRVRCKKKRWKRNGGGNVEQLKNLTTLRRLKLDDCIDYTPGDMEGAAEYRYSLPDNHSEYEEVWRRR